ncbi:hypothetical protein TNCV_146621 [Trichonephila clavipes]|nr:hypothetical protein TNCV_146621 [Trichonephila clavipes]
MFSIDIELTVEIRLRFQQLQNLAQKYALSPEVILSMDELGSSSSKTLIQKNSNFSSYVYKLSQLQQTQDAKKNSLERALLKSHQKATQRLLVMDYVVFNLCQGNTTPEQAPPFRTTPPCQGEDVGILTDITRISRSTWHVLSDQWSRTLYAAATSPLPQGY